MVAAHQPFVVNCVDRYVQAGLQPILIHSFAGWGGVGLAAAQRLRKRGVDVTTAITAFSTYNHETSGKLRGLRWRGAFLTRLRYEWEFMWTRLTVDPSERRGFYGSNIVLVNYDSVKEIICRQFGEKIRFGKMTYASEMAFVKDAKKRLAMPDPVARLEPKSAPLIVAVSRHDPRKGVDFLVRALAELRTLGVSFRACLVGGGPLLEAHRHLVTKLDLGSCTAVPGRVPEAYAYLEHADIFVLPSLEEGSGSVSLLEAMQSGVAAVVSKVDGLPEDVVDARSALLVEPGNVTALAAAVGRLLGDRDLRAQIAKEGYRNYRTRFSADAFVRDLRRVYGDLGFPAKRPS
jgi:glycosyltransferase involved in cell wall biosynthesis